LKYVWSAAELQEESDGKQSAKMYPAFSGEWSPGAWWWSARACPW